MNDRQRKKHDSNIAVRTVCQKDAYRSLWNSLPTYVTVFDRVLAKISYVNACTLIQTSNTKGITQEKTDARAKMTASTLEVAGALCVLALLRELPALEARADLDPSDLANLPDADVDDRATEMLTLARDLPAPAEGSGLPHLVEVGLTPGKLDLLETRTETYNLLLGSPRAARGEKTAATQNLDQTLDDIDRLFEKGLDKLMLQFKDTTFYQEYQLARDPIAVARKKQEAAASGATTTAPGTTGRPTRKSPARKSCERKLPQPRCGGVTPAAAPAYAPAPMSTDKTLEKVLRGDADTSIRFEDLCAMLASRGFRLRSRRKPSYLYSRRRPRTDQLAARGHQSETVSGATGAQDSPRP